MDWAAASIILLSNLAVFWPTLRNGFVFCDDDFNFLLNPNYRGLGWLQLRWMFGPQSLSHNRYSPLVWMSHGLDYVLWGMNPFGYHLDSLLIHSTTSLVFYFVARRLLVADTANPIQTQKRASITALLAALLFAIHPLRVEPIAWISDKTDVLAGLFFLLSILTYLKSFASTTGRARRAWYGASLGIFVLSLLSKVSGAMLPFVLLVLDIYPLRRLPSAPRRWLEPDARKAWLDKIPFLFLAIGVASIAVIGEGRWGVQGHREYIPWAERFARAAYGPIFYLWKTLVPRHLLVVYLPPTPFEPGNWRFLSCGCLLGGLTAGFYKMRRRYPAGLAQWTIYLLILAPVLGFIPLGSHLAADRYTYLPCMGWAILAAAALTRPLFDYAGQLPAKAASAFLALALLCLGASTRRQIQMWHDSETLWGPVAAAIPGFSTPYNNIGADFLYHERWEQAISWLRKALEIQPDSFRARVNLGWALQKTGRLDDAIEQYRMALQIDPNSMLARNNLAAALRDSANSLAQGHRK